MEGPPAEVEVSVKTGPPGNFNSTEGNPLLEGNFNSEDDASWFNYDQHRNKSTRGSYVGKIARIFRRAGVFFAQVGLCRSERVFLIRSYTSMFSEYCYFGGEF